MSKKNRKIIDNTRYFLQNAARKQARIEDNERQAGLVQAGEIFNDWQREVVIQSRKIEELPGLLNELAARLEKGVKHDDLRRNILNFVYLKLGDVFTRVEMEKNVIRVYVDCQIPNILTDDQGAKPCGWGGEAAFHRTIWDSGQASMECPSCKGKLTQADMKPVAEVKVERPNRIVRWTKKFKRTGEVLPKDVYSFVGPDQLLGFRFVRDFAEMEGFDRFALSGMDMLAIVKGKELLVGRIEFPDQAGIPPLNHEQKES